MNRMISVAAALSACAANAAEMAPKPSTPAPTPFGAVPTAAQVKHAERAFYAFCHFTVDTFTGREWGTGGESEDVFNPSDFSADQIIKSLKASGAKGVILTAKHHDGFCLWPTSTTEHSVKHGKWMDGKGDVVRSFADACKANDFDFGVYVSPWDRNHPTYGTPDYIPVYRKQIEELTTNYGKLFEVWFDGANGGSGYYKGKVGPVESQDVNTSRSVDRSTYYGWPETWAAIHKVQPEAIFFSDVGPGVRWVGNERGSAPDPCRATITYEPGAAPGHLNESNLGPGVLGGKVWCPAEVDVSIRGGWFFHPNQDPRTPENLMKIYMESIGRGATFNLNVPPDMRGRVHENDAESLRQLGEHLKQTFAVNLAKGASFTASNTRSNDSYYGPERLLDSDLWSAWVTDDSVTTPEVVIQLKGEKTFNLIKLREDIRLGQRLEGVAVDAFVDGAWKELAKAEAIGMCRLWRVPTTKTDKVRIRVTKSPVAPALSDFGLYLEPEFDAWIPPIGGNSKAAAKAKWKVIQTPDIEGAAPARNAIDGNPSTIWHTHGTQGESGLPQSLTVDLGTVKTLKGFTYTPRQDGTTSGMVDQYAFEVSQDGKTWTKVAEGEFGNLRANPIEQSVPFAPVKARYFKFTAKHALEKNHAVVAEIGIVE